MELDETDTKILRALQEDARRSFRELARRVGVSVPTVSARVATLERLGILAGYHAAIDPERLHQTRLVLLLACRRGTADEVGQRLARLPEVRWTIRTDRSRIVAEAVLPTSRGREAFLRRVRSIDGIISTTLHVAARRFKDIPRAILSGPLSAAVACFECGKPIEGEPTKIRMEGRTHFLCCGSCERLYRERFARIKAAIRGR